jgi:hypothetical protein
LAPFGKIFAGFEPLAVDQKHGRHIPANIVMQATPLLNGENAPLFEVAPGKKGVGKGRVVIRDHIHHGPVKNA